MSKPTFNLKWQIAIGLVVTGVGPLAGNLIYSFAKLRTFDPHSPTPTNPGFLGDTFTAACIFAGCALTLPILLAISRSPAFADRCAHNRERVSQTIRAARRTSWVVVAVAVLCIIQFVHASFS